jgi:hypothetical protein
LNILLWVLQILLAFHTLIGAAWKFTNTDQDLGSLATIPHGLWLALAVFEIICVICLILPAFKKNLSKLVSIGALGVAAEMILFCGIDLMSEQPQPSSVIYWAVTAVIALAVAYGRYRKPI